MNTLNRLMLRLINSKLTYKFILALNQPPKPHPSFIQIVMFLVKYLIHHFL